MLSLLLCALVAASVAFALSALLAWCGPVDRPRERGMHHTPTPTSGGLAMLGGTGAAVLLYALGQHRFDGMADALLFAVLLGLLGAADDVFDFGAKAKLGVQVVLACILWFVVQPPLVLPTFAGQGIALPYALAFFGLVLWSVVVINAVNFMDGSNGLIAGSMAIVLAGAGISSAALGVGGPLSPLALFTAAAALGFLPLNFPRARLFQGDAGALFLGGLAAALAPLATDCTDIGRRACLYAIPIALLPILTDVLMTLIARARRRARLLDAHREHLYQRWLAANGGNHAALAWRFWAITAAFTAAGFATSWRPDWAGAILVGAVGVAVAGWLWIDRSVRARA